MKKFFILNCYVVLFASLLVLSIVQAQQVQEVKVGDKIPLFTLPDLTGKNFSYQPGQDRVLIITFLKADQNHSERVLEDIKTNFSQLRRQEQLLDLVAVSLEAESKSYFQTRLKELKLNIPLLFDTEFKLWGKLGVIATPTTIVVDKKGIMSWKKAGYGYDFATVLRDQLSLALGQIDTYQITKSKQVETLVNNTAQARATRHQKTAKLLSDKGRDELAINELRKAQELLPESSEVLLELGRLLCRNSQNKEALAVVEKIITDKKVELAQIKMLTGWAQRQLGDLSLAEKLLNESLQLNPKSARSLFELGKIYQARKEPDKALQTYYRALSVIFKETPNSPDSH